MGYGACFQKDDEEEAKREVKMKQKEYGSRRNADRDDVVWTGRERREERETRRADETIYAAHDDYGFSCEGNHPSSTCGMAGHIDRRIY